MTEKKTTEIYLSRSLDQFMKQSKESMPHIEKIVGKSIESFISLINMFPPEIRQKMVYHLADELIVKGIKDLGKPSCRHGCAECCYMGTSSTETEVREIIEYVNRKKMHIDLNRLKDQVAYKKDETLGIIPKEVAKCVFLRKDKSCSIYSVRPLVCRKYIVKSNPRLCDVAYKNNVQVAVIPDVEILWTADAFVNGIKTMKDEQSLAELLLEVLT